jgi:diguanylate cyclase (GGDEF)-like protein
METPASARPTMSDGATEPVRFTVAPPKPAPDDPPVSAAIDYQVFVELLTRVGCHVYTGEVQVDGSYREIYTGPGLDLFLGGIPGPDEDETTLWNEAVHPEDLPSYLAAATGSDGMVTQIEYRMLGRDGITRWVLDQMWVRETLPDGRRIIDGVVTDITMRKHAEIGMRRLAHSDSLTGLSNRLDLAGRIDSAVEHARPDSPGVALLLLDLDGFKAVNDSFGHSVGDELLSMVALRLRGAIRPNDIAARLGGDEFAVLLENIDEKQAMATATRVLASLCTAFALSRTTVAISASIGLVHAGDARGSQDLMRDADVAMYRAKSDGKNRIVNFEPAMQALVLQRLRHETELRRSVENGDFVLHYQPLVDLDSLETIGAEALIRWRHPTRGLLAPAEFIEVAEDTGLMPPLGHWVIEQATLDAARWQAATGHTHSVSVNLSPRQLHDPELVAITAAALEQAGIDGRSLIIEITEHSLLKDADMARSRLSALRALGIRIAVDDFGTGYSSLAYLDRYPVDILKIDRSFIEPLGTSLKSTALVRSIIELASALEIQTVAEGIEAEVQLAILQSLGCDLAQGYLFAAPQPADQLLEGLYAARGVMPA